MRNAILSRLRLWRLLAQYVCLNVSLARSTHNLPSHVYMKLMHSGLYLRGSIYLESAQSSAAHYFICDGIHRVLVRCDVPIRIHDITDRTAINCAGGPIPFEYWGHRFSLQKKTKWNAYKCFSTHSKSHCTKGRSQIYCYSNRIAILCLSLGRVLGFIKQREKNIIRY